MRKRFHVGFLLLLSLCGCGSGSVAQGAAPSGGAGRQTAAAEVAIPDPPAEDSDADEPSPPSPDDDSGRFAGHWLEDWPNRGTCSDRVEVRVQSAGVSLTGSDCTDGDPYEYSDIRIEAGHLKFTLRVPETGRVLHYDLERTGDGDLTGMVNGGAEATVTWRRAER